SRQSEWAGPRTLISFARALIPRRRGPDLSLAPPLPPCIEVARREGSMNDKSNRKSPGKKPKVETLKVKKEVVQDLTENEAQAVQGGMRKAGGKAACIQSKI